MFTVAAVFEVSSVTELKKLSEYVFRDHQTNIYNQYYTMSKKVPDHFNVPIIVPIPNTVPLDP